MRLGGGDAEIELGQRTAQLGLTRRSLAQLAGGAAARVGQRRLEPPCEPRQQCAVSRRAGSAPAANPLERGRVRHRHRPADARPGQAPPPPAVPARRLPLQPGRRRRSAERAPSTSAASARRLASSSSSTASAASPANHSSPRSGSQPMPSSVTAGHLRCRAGSVLGTTGISATTCCGSRPTRTSTDPSPAARARSTSRSPRAASSATSAEARCPSAAATARSLPAANIDQRAGQTLAFLGQRPRGGRQPLPFSQRLLERRETLTGKLRPCHEVVALAGSSSRRLVGRVGRPAELGRLVDVGPSGGLREPA